MLIVACIGAVVTSNISAAPYLTDSSYARQQLPTTSTRYVKDPNSSASSARTATFAIRMTLLSKTTTTFGLILLAHA